MPLEPQGHYGPPPKRPRSPVSSGPNERVSNTERDGVVEQLRLNVGEGRLDMEEFGQRCERTWAAKTGADLRAVIADLPLLEPPEAQIERRRLARRAMLVPYVAVNLMLFVIWALTGPLTGNGWNGFWFLYPLLGWGVGVACALFIPNSKQSSSDRQYPGPAVGPGQPS